MVLSLSNTAHWIGSEPVKLLVVKSINSRRGQLDNEDDKEPLRELKENSIRCKYGNEGGVWNRIR